MEDRMVSMNAVIEVLRGLRNQTFEADYPQMYGIALIDFEDVCSSFQGLIPEIGLTELGRK